MEKNSVQQLTEELAAQTERAQRLQQIVDRLFEIAPPGSTKDSLWRDYQSLEGATPPGTGAKDDKQQGKQPPDYDVRSSQQERAWLEWVHQASDDELLAALRRCSSWNIIPAQLTRDALQERGYILVGGQPHEVTLQHEQEENP
jgi:hypothetical protein